MDPEHRSFHKRVIFLATVFSFWSVLIIVQLVNLQIMQGAEIKGRAKQMHRSYKQIPAMRGRVLDVTGKTLALSIWMPYIFADPSVITDPKLTVNALAQALGKGRSWKRTMLARISNSDSKFKYVQRRAAPNQVKAVRDLNLRGVHILREPWRKYPNRWLGSHVLGFINQDSTALEGLESSYNQHMQGKKGKMAVLRDGRGRSNGLSEEVLLEPVIGADVHVTLDLNIQLFAEDALRRGVAATQAESITALVMDPRTGALLAMANYPDFNPNTFSKSGPGSRRNRAIVDIYEPGSAFKIITAAAALDSGAVTMNQVFYSHEGPIKAYDISIRNHKPYGPLTVKQILWHSSNAGAIGMALKMKTKVFHHYIKAFGFGSKTGIDLPAESSGIIRNYSEWDRVSPYFLAIGHEISATPLQMITALSAIANGGYLMKPFVVSQIVVKDGTVIDVRPKEKLKRVIREETADKLALALRGVVTEGTAKTAFIEGTTVFGKTGTAQRIHSRKYLKDQFNSSFVGFFPAESPRYGIIVVVRNPKGAKVHGGDVAAPIFAEIGQRIIAYQRADSPKNILTVAPEAPEWSNREEQLPFLNQKTMPDFSGLGLRNLNNQARRLNLKLEIKGTGNRVQNQWPRPGTSIPVSRNCLITMDEG